MIQVGSKSALPSPHSDMVLIASGLELTRLLVLEILDPKMKSHHSGSCNLSIKFAVSTSLIIDYQCLPVMVSPEMVFPVIWSTSDISDILSARNTSLSNDIVY